MAFTTKINFSTFPKHTSCKNGLMYKSYRNDRHIDVSAMVFHTDGVPITHDITSGSQRMYMHEWCTVSVTVDRTPALIPEVHLMHPLGCQEVRIVKLSPQLSLPLPFPTKRETEEPSFLNVQKFATLHDVVHI